MRLVLGVFLALFLTGCTSATLVQLSDDTYMIYKEDHAGIFGNPAKMKAGVYSEAREFAAKQGKVMIPISFETTPPGPMIWPKYEYQFRLVDKKSDLAQNPPVLRSQRPSPERQIANEMKRQNDNADDDRQMRALQNLQQSFSPPVKKKVRCNSSVYNHSVSTDCTED